MSIQNSESEHPPSTQLPTTASASVAFSISNIWKRARSSCWWSASIAATIGDAVDVIFSTQAEARPLRPKRCRHLTRGSVRAISRTNDVNAVRRVVANKNNFPIREGVGNRNDHAFNIASFIKGWDDDRQVGAFHGSNPNFVTGRPGTNSTGMKPAMSLRFRQRTYLAKTRTYCA
jgi:hypothetical protein